MMDCGGSRPPHRRLPGPARTAVLVLVVAGAFLLTVPWAGAAPPPRTPDATATAELKIESHLSLTVSPNPATTSDPVTITVGVARIPGNPVPATGSIVLLSGGSVLGTGVLTAGLASWTGQLPAGTHVLTATYAGDTYYAAGTSLTVTIMITAGESVATPEPSGPPGTALAATGPGRVLDNLGWAVAMIVAGFVLRAAARRRRPPANEMTVSQDHRH